MIQFVVAAGLFLWLMQESKDQGSDPKPAPKPDPEPSPEPSPEPPVQEWTETSEWSGEYIAGNNVVWTFRKGIRYTDGTAEFDNTQYIVIGDKNHHNFLTQNSSNGAINIKWEFTGNPSKVDSKNVVVFPSMAAAEKKADELANPKPADPNDPYQPQPQPQPEEDDSDDSNDGGFGGLPPMGGLDIGQGSGSLRQYGM